LKVDLPGDSAPTEESERNTATLRDFATVLPPLRLPPDPPARGKWARRLFPQLEDYYPQVAHRSAIEEALLRWEPDVVFIPWSEWLTAACAEVPVRKFAYYGNPDPKRMRVVLDFERKRGTVSRSRYWAARWSIARFETLHLRTLRKYDLVGDVAANDAEYYRQAGHPGAFYIQNVWPDRVGESWRARRKELEKKAPSIVVGNIGKLGATANTLGLDLLGRELLPELRRLVPTGSYEVHLFGAGSLRPEVAEPLQAPEVRQRGFVDDIDREMLSAQVFLCMNNASPYKVGHTRYLHAWSLGMCVVGHADAALSMPEIVHRKNVLLGRNAREIAELTAEALASPALRAELGEAGYQTFRNEFTAPVVASRILEKASRLPLRS
jgi:glycosyltransferase involved in cell wall biosynthesis